MKTFAERVLRHGGTIKPLIIDQKFTNGTGLFNPSVFVDGDKIYFNVRHCQYTLYHAEMNDLEHPWGPLIYFNPDNDMTLTTTNYFGELNDDMSMKYYCRVDTSLLDINPVWQFVGLEDARIVKWDGKIYLCGVRRDVKDNGEGRMELSELQISDSGVKEVSRFRIPAPGLDNSYCEKNWMPILDRPYHFVKWSNPVEIAKADINKKTCETVFLGDRAYFDWDQRGGSQMIPFEDGYLCLTHEMRLERSEAGRKDGDYKHRFIYWDKNWNLIAASQRFSFLGAKIEFACGLAIKGNDMYMSFGFQDNAAYILKSDVKTVKDFIYA